MMPCRDHSELTEWLLQQSVEYIGGRGWYRKNYNVEKVIYLVRLFFVCIYIIYNDDSGWSIYPVW